MEPDFPPIPMDVVLTWMAFVLRDLGALLALFTATGALLVALITLLVRGRARLEDRFVESGILAWVASGLSCFVPLENSLLKFSRLGVIGILALSGAMWVVVFILWRYGRMRE